MPSFIIPSLISILAPPAHSTTVVKEKVEKDKAGRSAARKAAKEEAAKLREAKEAEEKDKGAIKEEDLTPSYIQKRSFEIVSSRGRKGTDPKALLAQLEDLSKLAVQFGPRVEIPVLMHVITAQFDMQRTIDDYMETPAWRSTAANLERIGAILSDDAEGWKVGPTTPEDEEFNPQDYSDYRVRLVGTMKFTLQCRFFKTYHSFKWSFLVRPYLRSIYQYRLFVALFVKQSGGDKEDQPESIKHFIADVTYKSIKKAKLS